MIEHLIGLIPPGEKLWTSTNESNTSMRALLPSLGFIPSGRIDNLDEVHRAPAGLLRAISSNVPELRKTAAMALGNIADPNTVDALIALLRDPDAEVRYAAVEGLGEIGTPDAVRGLTRALEDSDPEVRRAAVEALAEAKDDN